VDENNINFQIKRVGFGSARSNKYLNIQKFGRILLIILSCCFELPTWLSEGDRKNVLKANH